ncbi:MAG TPA: 4-hydroxythreonine-4-phosphate dehydrogenase PdxA [Thermodesulfobacteriota bacterium]|nr:4-hydroxythreonine-4-phosphate dehydrogenase PdxA [Thermodesulfobacteriota bacterium]
MSNKKPKAKIAITMGDAAGIGPEIIVKALERKELRRRATPVVIGDAATMEQALGIAKSGLKIQAISEVAEASDDPGVIPVLDLKNIDVPKLRHGKVDPMPGKAAVEYIQKAVALAVEGAVGAIVTAPIHKEAINKAGFHYAGHTELLAHLTDTKEYAMLLAHGPFRVSHVTTHTSMRKACDRILKDRVSTVIRLTREFLNQLGIEDPRIGVAGLNPHSGEDGLFGDEEQKEIAPAIAEACLKGWKVEGPVPPDTVFTKMRGRQYDAVVAMYHDQGHIAVKLVGFSMKPGGKEWDKMSGINMTLGLPIIRTSVDHGVAFGKAGEGRANPQSMVDAIKLAVDLAAGKARAAK